MFAIQSGNWTLRLLLVPKKSCNDGKMHLSCQVFDLDKTMFGSSGDYLDFELDLLNETAGLTDGEQFQAYLWDRAKRASVSDKSLC